MVRSRRADGRRDGNGWQVRAEDNPESQRVAAQPANPLLPIYGAAANRVRRAVAAGITGAAAARAITQPAEAGGYAAGVIDLALRDRRYATFRPETGSGVNGAAAERPELAETTFICSQS
jgi:hypothetical protein